MPLEIIRRVITEIKADAVVNTADTLDNASKRRDYSKVKAMLERQEEQLNPLSHHRVENAADFCLENIFDMMSHIP